MEVNCVYNGLQLMDYLLKKEGYKGISSNPDLVILDLNMPLADGLSVLEQMKKKGLEGTIPVIMKEVFNDCFKP